MMLRAFMIVLSCVAVLTLHASAQFSSTPMLLSGGHAALPSNIACDIGPNLASVPTPAQNAGFTTCALNADFTSSTFASTSSFVAGCGHSAYSNNTNFVISRIFGNPHQGAARPCGHDFSITSDGTVPQVLYMELNPSTDYSGANISDYTLINWPADAVGASGPCTAGNCGGGPNGLGLWETMYVQITYRITTQTYQSVAHQPIMDDWWVDACNGCNLPAPNYTCEYDFFETAASAPTSHFGNTHCATFANVSATYDDSAYHTVGILTTSDGPHLAMCMYVDGGINTATPSSTCVNNDLSSIRSNAGTHSHELEFLIGASDTTNCLTANSQFCQTNPAEVFIKQIVLLECSNYWGAQCTGPLITQ